MAGKPTLVDQWGRPVRRAELKQEVAAATVGGVRSPISGYPADGLTPVGLANILRAADQGDAVQYMELAELIEERDPHYLGVLGTRRRSVSQLDITVEPADDSAEAERHAAMIRRWLDRDELQLELFDMLDAISKGFSFTEILWDSSMGQWQPGRLEYRDPRWFRFARHDLRTPMMLDEYGAEVPLPAFKFIYARLSAKSGLPIRSGLSRTAMWAYLFKKYTERDWAIFSQTYGQPLRVGKWGQGASEADKDTLFRAVANIAGDCAAIIPQSMEIDFVEPGNLSATGQLYLDRCNYLDKQVSKAVLGQTSTTDAEVGGLGSGKEHREVQEDIERADAKTLSAILTAQLAVPWVQLEYGPQLRGYPRIKIARPEAEDLQAFTEALTPWVDRGLRVGAQSVLDKFGVEAPAKGAEILRPEGKSGVGAGGAGGGEVFEHRSAIFERAGARQGASATDEPRMARNASEARSEPRPASERVADSLGAAARDPMEAMLGQIEAMLAAAGSLEEFREMLLAAYPDLDAGPLYGRLRDALTMAAAAGAIEVAEEDRGDG